MKLTQKPLDALLSLGEQQLAQRVKMGDLLDRARPIEHTVLFPKRSLSDAWILRIRDDGYDVRTERIGFGGVKVVATMESSLEDQRAEEFVTRMYRQVARAGGFYQGWDGPLVLG